MNLKKNGKLFTSKFVGTGPSSYEKKILPDRGLTQVEKHRDGRYTIYISTLHLYIAFIFSIYFTSDNFNYN